MIQQQLLGQLVAGLRLLDLFVDERVHNADAAVHGERGRHLLVALVKVEAVNLWVGREKSGHENTCGRFEILCCTMRLHLHRRHIFFAKYFYVDETKNPFCFELEHGNEKCHLF